jgi:hypothetical protein
LTSSETIAAATPKTTAAIATPTTARSVGVTDEPRRPAVLRSNGHVPASTSSPTRRFHADEAQGARRVSRALGPSLRP